ncbi:MAG TPA: ATP-binding protein, partial [Vicinamibacteria bacterium]|nr:ATP-binding protein [Vicinamibacteria bacterium]
MPLRLRSLKTRTALALSSVIVAILVFNGIYMILTKRQELRTGIDEEAKTFARLTRAPIASAFLSFYTSDFYRFRELMRDLLVMERDVTSVLIVDGHGQVLFDSAELADISRAPAARTPRVLAEPERVAAAGQRNDTVIHTRNAAGEETLEVFAPYVVDEAGPHLAIVYDISYRRLTSEIRHLVWATGGLTLASIGISLIVALALATRITKPLSELTAGAKEIAQGHFDRRLDIRSNDELQVLSESFNDMTQRLKKNVEALEESNKKLASVNDELKELDRMKSDLLANVSHELRTPLTAIKGYTDYILERKLGSITDKQEKGLVVVQRNLERLSKSINALLDFSRMDVGRIVLNIQPFPLAPLVEQIHTTVRSELDKKGLGLETLIDPALPHVIADREKLSAVLENLVINAIKFTPEGGRITVQAARASTAGKPEAEITVTDTGIGIPSDQLARIFNRFHQVDSSSTRRFGGVGLGLAIVKSIVEAHDSTIEVESREGKGTVFRFRLPVLERTETPAPGAPDLPAAEDREPMVLVVDDERDTAELIQDTLRGEGLRTQVAHHGRQALEMIARRRPDLVILDIMMPERSGFEVLEALARDQNTSAIPVLVLTARGDEADARRGLALGARRCMSKPFE